LEKEALLRTYGEDEDFREVLKFLLNPMVVTGISSKKIDKRVNMGVFFTDNPDFEFTYLLDWVKEHNTGRDSDIAYINSYMWHISENEDIIDFMKSIITKSFKSGVDVKTCNKVYGDDFIPTLDVMLGTSIENCVIPDGAWISISQKLNGTRCFFYKGKLYSRQGKEYTGCDHIIMQLKALNSVFSEDQVFDGELILKEEGLSDSEAFQKGTGIAMSKDKDKSNLHLVIFDVIPEKIFETKGITDNYSKRCETLDTISFAIRRFKLFNLNTVLRFYRGTDHNMIDEWLEYAESQDMEGVMVNLDAPYEFKRTKNLIKVKKFYTYDLKCTGVEEGTGKNKGRLGAIIVDFKGNPVHVGSGFSDELRESIWSNPDSIIGKIIEVKYKEVTKNKDTGAESLQFPVFISVRTDKEEISYE
jgi:DNA ligase-1